MTNKITTLENIIYSAKGVLKVTIFNGADEIEILNNSTINVDVNCQNYGTTTDGNIYDNKLYIIKDYYLKLQNLSVSSELSFLVSDSYVSGSTVRSGNTNLTCLVDINNDFVIQEANQYIYFTDNANGSAIYRGDMPFNPNGLGTDTYYLSNYFEDLYTIPGLSSGYTNKNRSSNPSNLAYSALGFTHGLYNDWDSGSTFATVIAPQVNSIDDLKAITNKGITSQDVITIPLNIYWKFVATTGSTVTMSGDGSISSIQHSKTLRIRLFPSSISGVFDFKIVFNLKNKNS